MRVVCQNAVSIFAVQFFKRCWKLEKVQEMTTEIIWGMEKMSYIARLWSYGKKTILRVYTHFTKWEVPSAKGLRSVWGRHLKNSVQKKQLDKFRLEMRHAFLTLMMINHCHQLQSKMIDTPSLDALQRFGCIFIAHHCIEDCADCVTLDNVLYRMSEISSHIANVK